MEAQKAAEKEWKLIVHNYMLLMMCAYTNTHHTCTHIHTQIHKPYSHTC